MKNNFKIKIKGNHIKYRQNAKINGNPTFAMSAITSLLIDIAIKNDINEKEFINCIKNAYKQIENDIKKESEEE